VIDEVSITIASYEYKVQQYSMYVEAYEYGNRTKRVVAFNRRLWSVRRKIEHLKTGY